MRIRSSSLFVIIALAVLTFSSRLAFLLFPDNRTWGIDHLQFLPETYTIIYICCFFILCPLLIPRINSSAVLIFENLSKLFDEKYYSKWAIISLVSIPILWFFRMPTNLLGDGYAIINNIGNEIPVIYKWTEIGAIAVADFINKLLPYSGLQSATYAYSIVSVLSGAISIFFFCGIAHELSEDKSYRLFILSTLIFSGWTLLFFGYVENYPLLWAPMTGYLYFAIKYMNKKCSLFWPTLLLIVCHIIHLQSLFFAISFPLLLISRDPGRRIFHRYKKVILSIAGAAVISGIAAFLYKYLQSLAIQAHFLPLLQGKPPADDYKLISIPHIIDILNEYSLLIPLWPILLYLSIIGFKSMKRDSIWRFLASFSLGGLILILILDPRIGMSRDWDLFALSGLGPALLMLITIDISKIQITKYCPILALLSLLMVAPYFIVNLQYQPSIEYYTSLLELDREKSKSGMGTLRDYYFRAGEKPMADSINLKMSEYFPNILLVRYGQQLIDSGKVEQALVVAEKILKNEPYSPEGYSLRGSAYLKTYNYENALRDYRLALELEPYNQGHHLNFAGLYLYQKKYSEMLKYCRSALALNPNSLDAHLYLGTGYYTMQRYDSALVYFEKVIQANPAEMKNYKTAGYCAYYLRNKAKTKRYLSYYLENVPNDPDRDFMLQVLATIN
ncbi:MAG: hypothetical protein ABIE07_14135 [Candidatus Zixiibacteriota bacterium]